MPTVSVILATYNPEKYLTQTVQSVIDQSFADWEMVIVDDGSSADIEPLIPKHPAITLIRQKNRGLSVARNIGILKTTGEYLAFLDHDDVWMPEKLERQVATMRRDAELAFCYTDFERIDGDGNRIGDGFEGGAVTYRTLLLGCCICVSTTLVRRSAMAASGLFDPLFLGTQDYDMWLKLARQHRASFTPTPLAQYRQHRNNLSHRYAELWEEQRELFERHLSVAIRSGDAETIEAAGKGLARARRVYGCQAFDHSRLSWRKREYRACLRHLRRALTMAPGFVATSVCSYLAHLPRRRGASTVLYQDWREGSSPA